MANKATPTESDSAVNSKLQKCNCPHPSTTSRNLVVCIDGTSNQFGVKNTNIVELYGCLTKDETQITYYNSGTGTHKKRSSLHLLNLIHILDTKIDLAIAWNFQEIVTCAYRWLSEQYKEGDRIFLFGFSRGAYQVRALAGMIKKVGLIPAGNWEQIPFAYEFYARDKPGDNPEEFRRKFSKEARVHFVGVWDTVSSVGIIRGKNLPYTDTCDHVCFFRHALALDECRVKFLPEYIQKHPESFSENPSPRAKEVWFSGSHSEVGGSLGRQPFSKDSNFVKDVRNMSLLWMQNEARTADLRLEQSIVDWDFKTLRDEKPTNSLLLPWWMLEISFVRRQRRYSVGGGTRNTRKPHLGKDRAVVPGQKIHFSVAFKDKSYKPKATLHHIDKGKYKWTNLVGRGEFENVSEDEDWKQLLELDLFDSEVTRNLILQLSQELPSSTEIVYLKRLNSMVAFQSGREAIINSPNALNAIVRRLFKDDDSSAVASELLTELLPENCLDNAILSLTNMLEGRDDVRATAVELLRSLSTNISLDKIVPLIEKLKDEDDDIKPRILEGFVLHEINRRADNNKLQTSVPGPNRGANSANFLSKAISLGRYPISETNESANGPKFRIPVSKAIPRLIEMLKGDANARDSAVEFLKAFVRHGTDIRPTLESCVACPLFEMLKGEDGVRKTATELLKEFAQDDAIRDLIFKSGARIDSLVKMLDHDNDTRCAAAELLKALAPYRVILPVDVLDSTVTPALVKMLESGDSVSKVAELIKEFALHDDTRASIVKSNMIRSLVKTLGNNDNTARSATIELCKALTLYPDLRTSIVECHAIPCVVETIKANDDDANIATEFLLDLTTHDDVRASVFSSDVILSLVKMLPIVSRNVRGTVAELFNAISQYDDDSISVVKRDAIHLVVEMLEARDDRARSTAAEFLLQFVPQHGVRASIFTPDVIILLVKVLKGSDCGARTTAVKLFKALAQHHDVRTSIVRGDAIHSIVKMLEDHDDGVKSTAAGLLKEFTLQADIRASIFTSDVISSLVTILKSDDNGARNTAVELFKALAQYHDVLAFILDCGAIPPVVEMLEAQDEETRGHAAGFLQEFALHDVVRSSALESSVISRVVQTLESNDEGVRRTTAALLQGFALHRDVRASILQSTVVPLVVKMIESDNDGVRNTAAELLIELALHYDVRVSILESSVVYPVVRMLEIYHNGVRDTSARLLRGLALHSDVRTSILEPSVIRPVVKMLEARDDGVRSTAAGLLKEFAFHNDLRASILESGVIPVVRKMLESNDDGLMGTAAELLEGFAPYGIVRASLLGSNELPQLVNGSESDTRESARHGRGASLESLATYYDAQDTTSTPSIFSALASKLRNYF